LYLNDNIIKQLPYDNLLEINPFKVSDTGLVILDKIQGDQAYFNNYNTLSDINYKENITQIDDINLENIRCIKYNYRGDNKDRYGFIAQEIESVCPNMVDVKNNIKYIDYMQMIPLLLNKINKLEQEINELKNNK